MVAVAEVHVLALNFYILKEINFYFVSLITITSFVHYFIERRRRRGVERLPCDSSFVPYAVVMILDNLC